MKTTINCRGAAAPNIWSPTVQSRSADLLLFVALTLAAVLIFRDLGGGSIDYWDETLTAGRSLAFLHHADPLQLSINGELSMRKPPLMYVLNALSMQLLGIDEFGLRLPNAILGFAVFVLTGSIAGHIFGRGYAGVAVFILLGADLVIGYCREALTDTVFVAGQLLAIAAALSILRTGKVARTAAIAFGAGIAVAAIGKGLLAFALPVYTLGFFAFFEPRLGRRLLGPILAAIAPMALWIAAALITQPNFFQTFFREELLERVNLNSTYLPLQMHPPYWYLKKLTDWYALIGVPALLVTCWYMWRHILRTAGNPLRTPEQWMLLFIGGFTLLYLAGISLAPHKRDAYILTLLPLLALMLIGALRVVFAKLLDRGRRQLATVTTAAIALSVLHTVFDTRPTPDYKPAEKAVAMSLRHYVDRYEFATNDANLARFLHFYLDRPVSVRDNANGAQTIFVENLQLRTVPTAHASLQGPRYHIVLPVAGMEAEH